MMETFSMEYALIAVLRALLDAVTPELRAVVVDVSKEDQVLYIRFYYDGEVSEKLVHLWDCSIVEASAALGPDCFVDGEIERLDYPKEIPLRGRYAYQRKEEPIGEMEETFSMGYVLLAMQSALLGVVTPELRIVIVDVSKEEQLLYIRIYYDGEVSEELIELWNSAITKASATLGHDCCVDGKIERLDYPKEPPFRGRYVYRRKEERIG